MKSLYVVLALFLILSSSTVVMAADLTAVELQNVHEDPGDEGMDFSRLWMGNTSEYLVFVVEIYNSSMMRSELNVTLRSESGSIYLISASIRNDSYSLLVRAGESLINPIVAQDNQNSVQYLDRRIYFNENTMELGFYVVWDDIGGIGEVEVILWTGMPSDPTTDRLPDSGAVQFSGITSVDREINFNDAIKGEFSDTIITSETPSSKISTKDDIITSSDVEVNNNSGAIITIISIIAFFSFLFIVFRATGSSSNAVKKYDDSELISKNPISKPPIRNDRTEMRYIKELGREVRMCCYQTARLNETYCYCGRAVDEDVRRLFDKSGK